MMNLWMLLNQYVERGIKLVLVITLLGGFSNSYAVETEPRPSLWRLYEQTNLPRLSHRLFLRSYCMPCHRQIAPQGIDFRKMLRNASETALRDFLTSQLQWMPPDPALRHALQNKLEAIEITPTANEGQ